MNKDVIWSLALKGAIIQKYGADAAAEIIALADKRAKLATEGTIKITDYLHDCEVNIEE